MRADLHGPDHSETLDAARRAQNVGQECENDNEEGREEEELGLLQAHLATHSNTCCQIPARGFRWMEHSKHKVQAQIPARCPVRYKCTTKRENSSVSRHVSNATNGTSVIRSVKLCLPVAGNLSACLPACLCLPGGDMFPKYSQNPPTPSCKYSNAC